MRRAGAVSVWGAILLALLCIVVMFLLTSRAQAQSEDDLAGQEALIRDTDDNGTPNRIVIPFPEGQTCTADDEAMAVQITVSDEDGEPPVTFAEEEGGDAVVVADIEIGGRRVTITDPDGGDLAVPDGFEATENGEVEGSSGITCEEEEEDPPPPEEAAPPVPSACPDGFESVASFDSDATETEPFRITQEEFRVLYAVEAATEEETGDERFRVSVRQGGETIARSEAETEVPTDDFLAVDDLGDGRLRIIVAAEDVVFAVTVCQEEEEPVGEEEPGDPGDPGEGDDLNCDDFDSREDAQE